MRLEKNGKIKLFFAEYLSDNTKIQLTLSENKNGKDNFRTWIEKQMGWVFYSNAFQGQTLTMTYFGNKLRQKKSLTLRQSSTL